MERVRFWSIHLTVPTDAGRCWFKENCPAQAFEAKLVQGLEPVVGDRILAITATHAQEGWLLTPEQGQNLRDAGLGRNVSTCERLMIDYGQLQRALMAAGLDLTTSLTGCSGRATEAVGDVITIARRASRPRPSAGTR